GAQNQLSEATTEVIPIIAASCSRSPLLAAAVQTVFVLWRLVKKGYNELTSTGEALASRSASRPEKERSGAGCWIGTRFALCNACPPAPNPANLPRETHAMKS